MEIFHLENKKYIVVCPECSEILKFKINTENMTVSGECKNNHILRDKTIEYFKNNCIKSSNEINNKCFNCYELLDDNFNNFICLRCNKLFCGNCINKHINNDKHNIRKNFISNLRKCEKHERKYFWFCETCKINLCEECKVFHYNHSIKSFIDVIPSKNEIDLIKKNVKRFEEYIEEIYKINEIFLEDVRKRNKNLGIFLQFLKEINEKLFKNCNFSYFNYYNFENIKYISNLINNDEFYNFDKYYDYLFFGEPLILEENNGKNKKVKNNDKLMLTNLNYFKDDLFLSYKEKSIYLYEFKNFCFKQISKYDDISSIYSVKPAKYSNDILVSFKNKKNIKILKYNNSNKTFNVSFEIYSFKIYPHRNYTDYIDVKNNNIITLDNVGELVIWKKIKKKTYYEKDSVIDGNFENIFNINDSLFGIKNENLNNNIQIYDSIKYEFIKNIDFNCNPKFIGVIKNELIIFNNSSQKQIFLVDAKYLEIMQIIGIEKNYYSLEIKNKNLLIFYIDDNNFIYIKKMHYNIEEKFLNNTEIINPKIEYEFMPNIFITNNDYIVLNNKNKINILKI